MERKAVGHVRRATNDMADLKEIGRAAPGAEWYRSD
jgi:hypothetical protein